MFKSPSLLNLIEDEQKIKEIISEYLSKIPVLDWKYEDTIKCLLGRNLRFEPSDNNLLKLGKIYTEIIEPKIALPGLDEAETRKITSVCKYIHEICLTKRIKKLVLEAWYATQYLEEIQINALTTSKVEAVGFSKFQVMTSTEKMKFLCDKYGEEKKFDFCEISIPKRFQSYISRIKADLNLNLNPLLTAEEKDILRFVISFKNQIQLSIFLSNINYGKDLHFQHFPNKRIILSQISFLRLIKEKADDRRDESWFQTRIYIYIWSNFFVSDAKFTFKDIVYYF